MREIKFRVWDKVQNIMRTDLLSLSVNDALGKTIFFREGGYLNQENAEIMQYTGLKDKNGKEIYEGDICRVEYVGCREIKFEKGGFYFGEGTPMSNFSSWSEKIEIIGNIYENPELI
jgi:uncharacterized phage protein (TIGR01671 family)